MRETNSMLLQTSKDYAVDDQTSSTNTSAFTDSETFFQKEINKTVRNLYTKYVGHGAEELPRTMSTVASQIYYHYPPGLNTIKSITMSVGSVDFPLEIINSRKAWDRLQMIDYSSSTIPKYAFPRRDSFGIYPTPQAAYTVTLTGVYMPKDMTEEDYTTGTISTTQNSATVTGSGTTFTSDMVGRWFSPATSGGLSNGSWYRIAGFTSTTEITLESVFEEASLSGSNYIIGQSPDLPVEFHEFIPFRVAGVHIATRQKNPSKGQKLINYYFTGDFENPYRSGKNVEGGILDLINRYKTGGRAGDGQIVRTNMTKFDPFYESWTTTLSGDNHGN